MHVGRPIVWMHRVVAVAKALIQEPVQIVADAPETVRRDRELDLDPKSTAVRPDCWRASPGRHDSTAHYADGRSAKPSGKLQGLVAGLRLTEFEQIRCLEKQALRCPTRKTFASVEDR